MPVQLGTQGQADFSQPIELLMDCHRRIEHFLQVLDRVAQRYSNKDLDQQGREALETSLNYFQHAAPRHTADEEESLFPRMRQDKSAHVRQVMERIDRLEADHRQAELAHERIDKLGRQWLAQGSLPTEQVLEFESILHALTLDYQQHITLEDQQVFTLASKLLDPDALSQVGQEMRLRRQDNPGRPGSRCAQKRSETLGTTQGMTQDPAS